MVSFEEKGVVRRVLPLTILQIFRSLGKLSVRHSDHRLLLRTSNSGQQDLPGE
jgi:hypothetical protein